MKAIVNVLVLVGVVLVISSAARAGSIYWTPAHEWAPQGYSSTVSAGDLDCDGDEDLVLLRLGPVRLYWNVGTPQLPAWYLDETQFTEIVDCHFRTGSFGDLDADGDLDLVLICFYDDFVRFYWNTGSCAQPVWEPDLSVFDGIPKSIGSGQPRLADMDADGDLDLMLGSWSGTIRYAQNVGTSTSPSYQYVGWVDGVSAADGAIPAISLGDLDLDGDLDVVRVTQDTWPECFENVGTPQEFAFVENPDMLVGIELRTGGAYGIGLLDADADGDPDMILALSMGVNLLFLNEGTTPVEPTSWGVIKAMYR